MNEPEGLISLQEAARRLGVNSGTLRKMVKRGEVRAFRVRGYIIRLDPLDLRRFLRDNQIWERDSILSRQGRSTTGQHSRIVRRVNATAAKRTHATRRKGRTNVSQNLPVSNQVVEAEGAKRARRGDPRDYAGGENHRRRTEA